MPPLWIVILIIKAFVEGVKTLFGLKNEYVIRGIVFAFSAFVAWMYGVDVMGAVGLKARIVIPDVVVSAINAVVIGTMTMGGHDLLDYFRGKR
jgi:hypothetical protein